VATTLIPAVFGGTIADDRGDLRLMVPVGALAVATTVTIAAEPVARAVGWEVLGSWRIVADPAPAELVLPASLSVSIPYGVPAHELDLLLTQDGATVPSGWRRLAGMALAERWLDAQVWYLPPWYGPPPTRSSVLLCLARKP
jgi:hypothetical protein